MQTLQGHQRRSGGCQRCTEGLEGAVQQDSRPDACTETAVQRGSAAGAGDSQGGPERRIYRHRQSVRCVDGYA